LKDAGKYLSTTGHNQFWKQIQGRFLALKNVWQPYSGLMNFQKQILNCNYSYEHFRLKIETHENVSVFAFC